MKKRMNIYISLWKNHQELFIEEQPAFDLKVKHSLYLTCYFNKHVKTYLIKND